MYRTSGQQEPAKTTSLPLGRTDFSRCPVGAQYGVEAAHPCPSMPSTAQTVGAMAEMLREREDDELSPQDLPRASTR